jgi:D-threo-aldose 1-dehydrogenase
MFACSLTPYSHEPELIAFMKELNERGIGMINSAVFNAGFLVGGNFFDYRIPDAVMDAELFAWRDKFLSICEQFGVIPAEACIQFGMSVPGVSATALNTSKPANVIRNVKAISADIPGDFWRELKTQNIIDDNFPYLG